MANIEEKQRRVLEGLQCCGTEPYTGVECADCPYHEDYDDFCVSTLCRSAYDVITTLDTIINAMMGAYGDSCDVGKCGGEGTCPRDSMGRE